MHGPGRPPPGILRRKTLADSKTDSLTRRTSSEPGPGHNIDTHAPREEPVWERWTKKRVFVRALEGTYGELIGELFTQPRVYHSKDWKWHGGPHNYGKKIINPQAVKVAQSIETHIDCFAPGGYGQKHGHMNSAVFFVLKGKGHDVHDGKRHDWEAGDALIVENGCVHQHFNDDQDGEAIVMVMKAKPLFLFMHMLFQRVVDYPPKTGNEKQMNYVPPADL
jgi:mannose-6-phosphate isomerase-like protein (cupin superfamily)